MKSSSAISLRQAEEAMCRKRNEEAYKREHWKDVTQYFKTWERVGTKFSSWTSESYYDQIGHLQNGIKKENEFKIKLEERREKLRNKLLEERKLYEIEMKDQSSKKKMMEHNVIPLEDLQNVNIEVHRRQQEALRKQAEMKTYLAWKANNPQLVEFNRKQHTQFIKRSWIEQILDKQRQRELEEKQKAQEELKKLKEIKIEQEKEKIFAEKKQEEVMKLREELLKQMELLRLEDVKNERLKLEESKEMQIQQELDDILIQREIQDKKRRTRDYGLFLTKQYQLKLKRRARQIQEQLIEDKVLLDDFYNKINNDIINEQLKLETRKEIDKANIILTQLIEREKQREKDMDFIFYEDARILWEKQELKWNNERQARNKLLNEILITIKKQINEKLEKNIQIEKELIKEREQLLKNVEKANEEFARKEKELEECRKVWKKDIEIQMLDKELRQKEEKIKEEEEKEREKQKRIEEEQKLAQELEALRATPFTPANYPRRRIVW